MPIRCLVTLALCLLGFLGRPTVALAEPPPDFNTWLGALRVEAAAAGIRAPTIAAALANLEPIPRVLELDRHQPESRKSLDQYLQMLISPERIRAGRRNLRIHQETLARVEERFGVPPQILVALWGIESNYGAITGSFPVIGALATLAHDQRRAAFFRRELLAALRLLDQGVVGLSEMQGSWAGAMGELQFLPSVLAAHGQDLDQDGHIAIWQSGPDLFATGAAYLAASGWQRGRSWGFEVEPSPSLAPENTPPQPRPIRQWQQMGFRPTGELTAMDPSQPATLLRPGGNRAFLVLPNFAVLLHWNRSDKYVLAVGLLADQIGATQHD